MQLSLTDLSFFNFGRNIMKCIVVTNQTLYPLSWRISNINTLPVEFSLDVEQMTVAPLSDFDIKAYFNPMRPMAISKKPLKFEVRTCFVLSSSFKMLAEFCHMA